MRGARLKLKTSKCVFSKKVFDTYLAHKVSQEGEAMGLMNTDQVASLPVPQSAKEVQQFQFLGLANYVLPSFMLETLQHC